MKTALKCYFLMAWLIGGLATSLYPQQKTEKEAPIDVRELIKSASQYSDRVVLVKGCYDAGFEKIVLEPCDGKFEWITGQIWLDNDGKKGAFARLGYTGKHPLVVVLRGDFKTDGEYGQLGAYRNSLMVHQLVWRGELQGQP